jgi:hypothetical protein
VGDSAIHKRFLDSHVPLLQEFPALQSLADKMWDAALDRYNEPLDHAPVGEELEKATALRLAQIIVFYLARASFDCFYDIFLLAGNGRGFAAKMMLRPMHEHLVTATFIAIKPDEAKHFNDHASVEKWKMWIRTLEAVPQAGGLVPAEDVEELKRKQQEVRDQLKSEICKKCGTPKTQEAWTRVALDNMAEEVDIGEHFRLYDLRHTFATRAVAGGVDLPTLSAMLGHTSIQMTMRYVHPAEEQKKIAAGKLEAFRIAGIVQAIEKSRSLTTIPTTVN